jgi:hypothetical protein
MTDGKSHVKTDKEFKQFNRLARKAKSDEEMPGAFDEIESLKKKLAKLEKAQKDDNKLLFGKCEEIKKISDNLLILVSNFDMIERRVEVLEELYRKSDEGD